MNLARKENLLSENLCWFNSLAKEFISLYKTPRQTNYADNLQNIDQTNIIFIFFYKINSIRLEAFTIL